MFSFLTGSDPKNKNNPDAKRPINQKDRKQATIFSKGVTRFLRYNKDLLPKERIQEIETKREEFLKVTNDPGKLRKDLDDLSEGISKICKKSIPDFQPSVVKENIEVLFVAVVIAMGIRAYFVQQFKIPTGSMQPTLNGIIAYPAPEIKSAETEYRAPKDYQMPNPITRLIDSIWFGRSHVEWRAKEDGDSFSPYANIEGKSQLILFQRTYLRTRMGHKYSAAGTEDRVLKLVDSRYYDVPLKKGDVIARGYMETGDMLIVNKMAYHWRKPKRGEVFVFHTRGIEGIQRSSSSVIRNGRKLSVEEAYGSQHYIKRLVGVPGDHVKVAPPGLIINNEEAKEFGMKRVAAQEGRYTGYVPGPTNEFHLGAKEYLAFGDNSSNSSDSRMWGTVKESNIVGSAMFVFYPFGNHFGPIK